MTLPAPQERREAGCFMEGRGLTPTGTSSVSSAAPSVLLARNANTNLLDLQEDDEQKALISVLEDGVALCHVPT